MPNRTRSCRCRTASPRSRFGRATLKARPLRGEDVAAAARARPVARSHTAACPTACASRRWHATAPSTPAATAAAAARLGGPWPGGAAPKAGHLRPEDVDVARGAPPVARPHVGAEAVSAAAAAHELSACVLPRLWRWRRRLSRPWRRLPVPRWRQRRQVLQARCRRRARRRRRRRQVVQVRRRQEARLSLRLPLLLLLALLALPALRDARAQGARLLLARLLAELTLALDPLLTIQRFTPPGPNLRRPARQHVGRPSADA